MEPTGPHTQMHTLASREDMERVVEAALAALPAGNSAATIALSGELGAGKTTFTQLLAAHLGVHEHVTSPTFVLMRVYDTHDARWQRLVHIDAYRVEDVREIEVLHIPEYFREPNTLVCIEWPERIAALIPKGALRVHIEGIAGEARQVTITTVHG